MRVSWEQILPDRVVVSDLGEHCINTPMQNDGTILVRREIAILFSPYCQRFSFEGNLSLSTPTFLPHSRMWVFLLHSADVSRPHIGLDQLSKRLLQVH